MADAVLVIDMLVDFVTGKLRCERASRIIPNIKKLLEAARRHGMLVVYVGDAHLKGDKELELWGEHAMAGTRGAEVIPELEPWEGDYVLGKRTYSAFHETGLDMLLRSRGVDRVIITGLHTNICDRHTAADAFFRGYRIVVVEDGVEAFTEKDHLEGLEYLRKIYGAGVKKTEDVIREWEG
jgi:nicotinamidase-related amidase